MFCIGHRGFLSCSYCMTSSYILPVPNMKSETVCKLQLSSHIFLFGEWNDTNKVIDIGAPIQYRNPSTVRHRCSYTICIPSTVRQMLFSLHYNHPQLSDKGAPIQYTYPQLSDKCCLVYTITILTCQTQVLLGIQYRHPQLSDTGVPWYTI